MRKRIYYLVLVLSLVGTASLNAQVTIGSQSDPHEGAILDLKSGNNNASKGLLLPNVNLLTVSDFQLEEDQDYTPAKAAGMVIYNTNSSVSGGQGVGVYVWDGSKWLPVSINSDAVSGVSISPTVSIFNKLGLTDQLTATILPSDASNKSVTWLSSNPSVATVSSTGLVTAVAYGTAVITATTQDGGKTASCPVVVFEDK